MQNSPRTRIIVAGTENILWNVYRGNQRSMLITNCIFRLGGVAFLLSNHPADRRRAKYRLTHMVRTHLGASDEAYKCAAGRPLHAYSLPAWIREGPSAWDTKSICVHGAG